MKKGKNKNKLEQEVKKILSNALKIPKTQINPVVDNTLIIGTL